MGDSNLVSNQLVADTPYKAEPKPVIPKAYYEKTSQSFKVTCSQDSLAKNVLRESQTKRLVLEHPISTSHLPSLNFSMVSEGLYRSGYPQAQDYPFIQSLKLKTIVTLVSKELPDGYQEFIQGNHITHKIFDMAGTKKEDIPIELMRDIQAVVSKRENYPLLIHCNHGKHRTGCVVGVFRKSNKWDTKRIIDEYTSFAAPKVRETDLKYLTEFELTSLLLQPRPPILPGTLGRFCRFIVVVTLALFAFYPLGKLRIQEPHPKPT
ncbi:tyrosine phosphatase family-domain-containing protein [Xylariaceae sp. AK1471]|nr:tyrosine phosphatase family-domain-containing protein [Xylariaceae sp. AK1471]